MTPKEKAKDLVDEYFSWYGNEEYFSHEFAKECALIAVDEIYNSGLLIMVEDEQYWYDVKQEIKLL